MILFCGIPSEPPLQLAIEAAAKLGAPYMVFNQREAHFSDISFEVKRGEIRGFVCLNERVWPLENFTGVYARLMDWRALPENSRSRNGRAPDSRMVEKSSLFHEALAEWIELAKCRVLNKASAMGSNMSKPYQAQLIMKSGLRTPPTLVTNDPAAVRLFAHEHRRVIFKSTSSIRSIVRELTARDLKNLDKVRYLPTQFQAFIGGTNIRVHVVGDEVFPTLIESEAVDYRYAGRDGQDVSMRAIELPETVRAQCVELSRQLNLPLCGIDLKRTPEGEYYCFEVNPSPAYSYYEHYTEQPIAEAIARYLAKGDED